MARFSVHNMKFDSRLEEIPPLEYEEEPEPETCEPDTRLSLEASGSERFPTFTVSLVMNKEEIGQRVFQIESDALLCLETLYPILSKDPSVALKEFLEWSPE
jgi:hypothetical protein